MSPFTARMMREANMRPAVFHFEADDRGIPICQSFDRLAFEQRTLFGIFKKYEISFMLRTIMSLDRQLGLHFAAFQRASWPCRTDRLWPGRSYRSTIQHVSPLLPEGFHRADSCARGLSGPGRERPESQRSWQERKI